MAVLPAGDVFVVGRSGRHTVEGVIHRYSANDGSPVASKEIGAPLDANNPLSFISDVVTDGTTIYAVGHAGGVLPGLLGQSAAGLFDAFTISVGPALGSSQLQLVGQVATPGNDITTSVAVGPSGAAYMAGWTTGTLPGQTLAGASDAFVARLR
jgi:hypothetical protein